LLYLFLWLLLWLRWVTPSKGKVNQVRGLKGVIRRFYEQLANVFNHLNTHPLLKPANAEISIMKNCDCTCPPPVEATNPAMKMR
jgi:hypothetical protein